MADQDKTEKPTQQRLKKAREEGQFASAKEFVSGLQFLIFLALLGAGGGKWFGQLRQSMRSVLQLAFRAELTPADVTHLARQMLWQHFLPLIAGGAAVLVTTLAFRLATTQFGFSFKKLAPDFKRLNSFKKLKELPSQNLPMVLQASVMLPIFLWAVYVIAREKIEGLMALPMGSVASGAAFVTGSLMELFWKAAGVFMLFGCVDLFRQLKKHSTQMKMSKQDIRDESKNTEGNPQMKARIRRIQRDRRRKQMMKDVPTATAVIVNPTHYAVAIRYSVNGMAAPAVVAKGKNLIAHRIRQIAIENQVPIIENPPLARALYKAVEVGQEIPPDLYRAVAEILAYIFKLMNGRLPG